MATTSTAPHGYDANVYKTIPYYTEMQAEIIDLVTFAADRPGAWLDTGGGTGSLIRKAAAIYPDTHYTLADLNPDMLLAAQSNIAGLKNCRVVNCACQLLDLPDDSQDIISAILVHHYLGRDEREKAVRNCYRMLKPGGLFITAEHTAPETEKGRQITLSRWQKYQSSSGKTSESAAAHIARYNTEYFPITRSEHIELMNRIGFSDINVLWASYCDVIFYAFK